MTEINQYYLDLKEEIRIQMKDLRTASINKTEKKKRLNPDRPISSWIKEDRLRNGLGYEFVVILRTKGCSWARSSSGGCTMCGYINDCSPDISQDNLYSQFESALEKNSKKIEEIRENKSDLLLKIFTSGSFFDDAEVSPETRKKILKKTAEIDTIKELLVETRPDFVSEDKLIEAKTHLGDKKLELGIGMESSNKFVREILINKGFSMQKIKQAIKVAHGCGVKIKTYLLLKPPFLSEKIAIRDAVTSIKKAVEIGADTISLNPVNIQRYTVTDRLYYKKLYRPPWIYSVIEVFRQALNPEDLKNTLILCDPSSAGRERGVHNCNSRECNSVWLGILKKFISTQDLSSIAKNQLPFDNCKCWGEYNMSLDYLNY